VFGNLSFNFLANDGSVRQVLLTFVPNAAPTPTPTERIQSVIASINGLVANSTLRSGQANGLIRPLQNALRSLAAGHPESACSQVSDFEAGVQQKILDGVLSASDGQALIDAAEVIRRDLGC
jgi:hypothetical protein